ncbi:MAG: efflux RND transporter periplasmic adaptor subunit [Acidobacteriota bacterium]
MSRLPRRMPAPLLLAGAALAGVMLAPRATAQEPPTGPPPTRVITARVETGPVHEEVTLPGTVGPLINSLVAGEIDGRVAERLVEKGDLVKKGQPLFHLDGTRLTRDLASAQGELIEVRARLRVARRQETRARDLHGSDVLAEQFLDDAVGEREALDGRLAQTEARLASIQDDLERTTIRAPFAGVITDLRTEVGEWLRRGDPVARLEDLDTLEIALDVPARYYPHLTVGAAAPATLDALPGVTLAGKVFAVVPRADETARTFPLLVRAANPDRAVGAGMLARVTLVLTSSHEALKVPQDAIVRRPQGEAVFLLDGDAVRIVRVRSGRTSGASVEVAGDLKAGDRVVVRGNERLLPGQKVIVGDAPAIQASGSR